MPTWFAFNDTTIVLTPTTADLTCHINATDAGGKSVNTSFGIEFIHNDFPGIPNPAGSASAETYVEYSQTIDLTNVFNNTETDQTMTYTTSDNFPPFLTHELNIANELVMSGTPGLNHVGETIITLTASDGYVSCEITEYRYANSSDSFNLTVFHVNRAPTVNPNITLDNIDTYVDNNDVEFSITGLFSDFEDDDASLNITFEDQDGMSMPSWFNFSNPNVTITPTQTDIITCYIIATDSDGGSRNTSFIIKYATNNPPTIANPSGSMSIYDNVSFTHTIDMETVFNDLDTNQTLMYATSNVPSFLTEELTDDNEVIFTGTPGDTDIKVHDIDIVVSDG